MPELPEVETVKNVIEPLIKGKTISKVEVFNKGTIITDLQSFSSSLENESFISLDRKGKFLIFHLSNSKAMLSHLRMEGKYFFFENNYKKSKHDMVAFYFNDGSVLAYNDVRKFGILGCYSEFSLMSDSPLNKLGKEPFVLTDKELFESLRKCKTTIKEALLDQSRIAGLGNIYVDETLFASNIHPKTNASSITLIQCQNILRNSRQVLNEAIKEGGSTIKSFHPAKGVDGRMQNRLKVYGHDGEACPNCGTKLRKITVGGRGTTFCPNCQHNIDMPFVIGVTGPIHSGKTTVSSLIEKEGFIRINCDDIVHELYETPTVISKVSSIVKKDLLSNGKLDRKALAEILSNDKTLKNKVVEYIHPLVAKEAKKAISKIKPTEKVVFEVPLLVGSGCEDLCDYVILVEADENTRQNRLNSEGKSSSTLMKINASYRLKETEKIASGIIKNNDSIESLSKEIKVVLKSLKLI